MNSDTPVVATEGASLRTFAELNLSPLLSGLLERYGFKTPTPIQSEIIPIAKEGKDVIGIAQTGTGKTLGFVLPILEQMQKAKHKVLIVLPTRELALQVEETVRQFGRPLGFRSVVLIGGAPMFKQIKDLKVRPDIMIGTPGRIIDHIDRGTLPMHDINIIVLDEADHMFDMGFAPQVKEIMKHVQKERQTLLFSATMPHEILRLAEEHLKTPIRIEVAPQGSAGDNITQEIVVVERREKYGLLKEELIRHTGTALVFTRTKHEAERLAHNLTVDGIESRDIHSNLSLQQRRRALDAFKNGVCRVLVATDIAARGIDVKNIATVVNYDLPEKSSDYVHRIGRTGRGGASGVAISFASPDQFHNVGAIERLIRTPIIQRAHLGASFSKGGGSFSSRGRGSYRGGGRSYSPRGGNSYTGGGSSRGGYSSRSSEGGSRGYSPRGGQGSHSSRGSSRGAYTPRPEGSYSPRGAGGGRSSSSRGSYGGDRGNKRGGSARPSFSGPRRSSR